MTTEEETDRGVFGEIFTDAAEEAVEDAGIKLLVRGVFGPTASG
jgi:hypothetical protein